MWVLNTESLGDRTFIDAILQDRVATPSLFDGPKAPVVIDAAVVASTPNYFHTEPTLAALD